MTTAELERQIAALQQELHAVCAQYDDALREIERLSGEHERVVHSEAALRETTARDAVRLEQLEQREQRYRSAAEIWARDSEVLTSEMESASLVQRFMIHQDPLDQIDGLEVVSSYRPAGQTGGDWFGYDRDAEAFTILIGDATGHGLPASLLTAGVFAAGEMLRVVARLAQASADLHAHLTMLRRPELLLTVLHDVVAAMGGGRYGMTFLAARYDTMSRTIHVANAAHPPPLWIRRDAAGGAHAQALPAHGGTPLGLGARPALWSEHRTTLAVGDLMLFYSDGLTDALDVKGRALGARRVADWLIEARDRPMDELRDLLQSRFDNHVAGRVVHDDVTFVLARIIE